MKLLLRLEYAAMAVLLLLAYTQTGASWWLFAALFLVPDITFLAYLAGPKVGAVAYNIAHSWIGPSVLLLLGWLAGWPLALPVAVIWASHIAVDRALGYGLKYRTGFNDTHLGPIRKQ